MADPISDLILAVEVIFDIAEFAYDVYEAGLSISDLALEGGAIFEEIVDACVSLYNDFSWEKFLSGDLHIIDRISKLWSDIKKAFVDPAGYINDAKKKVDDLKRKKEESAKRVESPEFTDLLTGGVLHKKRDRDQYGQKLQPIIPTGPKKIPLEELEKANDVPTVPVIVGHRQPRSAYLNPDIYPEDPIEKFRETNLNIPSRYDSPNPSFGMATFLHRTRQ